MIEKYEHEHQGNIQELLTFILKSGLFTEKQFAKLGSVMETAPAMVKRVEGIYNISKMPTQENKKSYLALLETLREDIKALSEAE